MFTPALRRAVPALVLAAALAGCAGEAGSGGSIPQTASQAPFQRSARSMQHGLSPNHRGSWMSPEPASQSLLYVSDTFGKVVNVYTYPRLKYAGQLTGFAYPLGECSDKIGNVWIADAGGVVYEYAHGGTSPINTLKTWMYSPEGCAIEPKTGDLAVANGNVEVLVFQGGAGSPTAYRDFNFSQTVSLGYDGHGNLFVDGEDQSSSFHYAELPKGGEAFTDITLQGVPPLQGVGGVQWDGTYMAVGDSQQNIYRTQGANVVSTTTLSATCPFAFYIIPLKNVVIAPDQCSSNLVGVYAYPAGGSPTKVITTGMTTPYGAVLSR